MNRGPNTLRILIALALSLAGCNGQVGATPGEGDAGDALPGNDVGSPPVVSNDPLPSRDGVAPTVSLGSPGSPASDDAGAPSTPPTSSPTPPASPDAGTTSPTPTPAPTPTPTPTPAPAPSAPDAGAPARPTPAPAPGHPSLGALPAELSALAWPTLPHTTRTVTATTIDQINAAAATAGTRIVVSGVSGGDVNIAANDIDIVADAGTSLGLVHIPRSTARVRVTGGHWAGVRVEVPAVFVPAREYRPEWMAQDLWFENMTIDSGGESAFEIRGRRIAIVRTDVTAGLYSVWCGDTDTFQSEDVILFDNTMRSAGPQATVRLVSVLRSAVVSNQLSNTYKHNYRIHGTSDLNYASDNLLAGTGVMFGTMPEDSLGTMWFDDNVMHHSSPDLFNPSPGIRVLHARRNMAYTSQPHFYGGPVQPGWDLAENQVAPYTPAPAF